MPRFADAMPCTPRPRYDLCSSVHAHAHAHAHAHTHVFSHRHLTHAPPRYVTLREAAEAEAATADAQASESKWNTNDYHWEERDCTAWATDRLRELVVGSEVWRDKKVEGDELTVTGAELDGYASSCVRKGKTINTFEFTAKVTFEGRRGGGALSATATYTDLVRDGTEDVGSEVEVPAGVVESKASAVADSTSSTDKDGNIVQTEVPVSSERAMRCSEMLLKLVTKKGEPAVREKLLVLVRELLAK